MTTPPQRLWIARLLIGAVFFFNVQCAIAFLWQPALYAPAFELSGVPGEGMLRGMGVLFLMWNVPYAFALVRPVRRRVSLIEAVIMQAVGLLGESLILLALPGGHAELVRSITRFILFDGGGLLLLILALLLTSPRWNKPSARP